MKVLVINCGSSSLKYQLIDMENEQMLCKGVCENIGTKGNRTLINTQFYVSEILNMTRKAMMTETRLTDPCGKVKKGKVETMSMDSPDRFYLLYRYDKKLDRPVNIR